MRMQAGAERAPGPGPKAKFSSSLSLVCLRSLAAALCTLPVLAAAADGPRVVLGGEVGRAAASCANRFLGVPFNSLPWLRADLTGEKVTEFDDQWGLPMNRPFKNYSGDISGRFIEIMALDSRGDLTIHPALKGLLRAVSEQQRPGGYFCASGVIDWQQPIDIRPERGMDGWGRMMPALWGNSRLLCGLVEAARAFPADTAIAGAARRLGDFYIAVLPRFNNPDRMAEYTAAGSYAAGYVTCWFPAMEGLVKLGSLTGERKYIEAAAAIAEFYRRFDRLPIDHAHGMLCGQVSLLLLFEATREPEYLARVEKRWEELVRGGYINPAGGILEKCHVRFDRDEGCAIVDWLRLNLALGRVTGKARYWAMAERTLHNHFLQNQTPKGGFGHRRMLCDEEGVYGFGDQIEESTWCCTYHGELGFINLRRHLLAGSDGTLTCHFALDFTAKDGARTTTSVLRPGLRAGEVLRQRISLAGQPAAVIRIRKPLWADTVMAVDAAGASLPLADEDGWCATTQHVSDVEFVYCGGVYAEDRHFTRLPGGPRAGEAFVLGYGPKLLAAEGPTAAAPRWPATLADLESKGLHPFPTELRGKDCFFVFGREQERAVSARWIWSNPSDPAPKNRFTWFRKVVDLKEMPADATLHLAADSNARVWINGQIVRRKTARYHEDRITAERINAAPYLHAGKNVILVLHHNWGDVITFQRTGNKHAGLYAASSWVNTDPTWKCLKAPEYMEHEKQIVGVIGDRRIRYPVIDDGRKAIGGDLNDLSYDDSQWTPASIVENGPWPAKPMDVETPGQREYAVRPAKVLAAGTAERSRPLSDDPLSMAAGIRTSKCRPDAALTRLAGDIVSHKPVPVAGKAGETKYITFDFHQPTHGYPFLALADAPAGVKIDFGYCELSRSSGTGKMHVDETGWIDPEGVVGPGYSDRYITRAGSQAFELPDERTARWLALHIHFAADGQVTLSDVGIIRSQYPVDPAGTFECGDQRMAEIVRLCLIHAEVSMSDAYVDTPGREDGQWIEDDRPRAILAARWFGDHQLRRFLIRTFGQGQGKDGQFHPFAPSNFPAYPATYDWSVQWVAALYDDYQWTGQTDLVREYWVTLSRYWEHVLGLVDEEGLWKTAQVLADIRNSLELENDKQSSGLVTPWIIERLGWSAEMAEAIGKTDQARAWRGTREKMIAAFRKYHVVPAKGDVPAHVGDRVEPGKPGLERGYCQAGQTVAIITGLLSREEAVADLNYAFLGSDGSPGPGVKRWNNPTYGYRSLQALSDVGLGHKAVNHVLERYAPYLPGHPRNKVPPVLQGPFGGPLPEYWISREDLHLKDGEKNTAQPNDETGSHGWGCLPLLWMHESLLGVRIVSPGGGNIRIAPDDGGLPYVAGTTCTPKGRVYVYWDPQQWRLEVRIPANVKVDLVLPPGCQGKRVEFVEAAGPVEPAGEGRFALTGSGTYVLLVR